MNRSTFPAAAGALLWVAVSAHAGTVSGLYPNTSFHPFPSAPSQGGRVELMIVRPDVTDDVERCSGALLSDGISILTSAQCLADKNGVLEATAATVTFILPEGSYTARVNGFRIDPGYAGDATSAPYSLYTDDAWSETATLTGFTPEGPGAAFVIAGGGFDGTGQDALADHPGPAGGDALNASGEAGATVFADDPIAGLSIGVESLDSSFIVWPLDASVLYQAEAFFVGDVRPTPEPKSSFVIGLFLITIALLGKKRA